MEKKTRPRKNLSLNRVFHKLDHNKWKMHTRARATKQKYVSISLYENLFEKGCIYIYIYIYFNCQPSNPNSSVVKIAWWVWCLHHTKQFCSNKTMITRETWTSVKLYIYYIYTRIVYSVFNETFHLRCFKNENLWCFSPYHVTTTIIWPTSDRIHHSLIFKRMQIKRTADNGTVRKLFIYLSIWKPFLKRVYIYIYIYIIFFSHLFCNVEDDIFFRGECVTRRK